MHSNFLQDLAIILAVAGIVTLLFHKIKQPVVLGYIIAGVIVGPKMWSFAPVHDQHTIENLAELGVILLMFGLGLHFSLKKILQVGLTALVAAVLEIAVMFLAGYALGRAFGWGTMDSIFLGAILSISSTTIIIKALQDLGLVKAEFANIVFGILIIEDILAIAMLALLSSVASTGTINLQDVAVTLGKLSVFLTVVLVVGLLFVPVLIRYVNKFKSDEMLLIVVLALCFGVSLIALRLDYSVALGAFLIGAIVAETREHGKIEVLVAPVRDMFAAVFFVAIGMLIDPQILWQYRIPILVITIVVVLGKIFACGLGSLITGHDRRTALRVGMCVSQIGEFSFIIATLGFQRHVTSDFLYPITIAVSALTTLLTPYLIKSSDPLTLSVDRYGPRWLIAYIDLYTTWVSRLNRSTTSTPHVRKLFIRWAFQLSLNFALLTGILIASAYLGKIFADRPSTLPTWTGGPAAGIWLIGTLLALPLLIAILRKLRAVAMTLAELSVTRAAAGERAPALRAVVANTLLTLGILGTILWMVALTYAILPPWPVLVVLLVLIVAIAIAMWGSFIRVYAKAQINLAETFRDNSSSPIALPSPALPILEGAELLSLTLTPQSPGAGKLIRELQVRTTTGASVVGIDRAGTPIINPGPDEELRPGDRVLLLGTDEQLQRAALSIGGPAAGDKSASQSLGR